MAIDDTFTSHPYESSTIVLPQRRFFPCDIQVKHWQLRNLISSDRPNIINYISVANVLQLDLNTNKVSLIADLTFVPRCSASGFGYICAAGEEGGVIAIINTHTPDSCDAEEQSAVPGLRSGQTTRRTSVEIDKIGSSIINSIAIYKIKGDAKLGTCDDVVAVLTNNDMTVRILSLSMGHETAILEMTFPVNHATISPDGQTLVAVGDHQQAHFFEKVAIDPVDSKKMSSRYASDHCRWLLLNVVRLHYPQVAGISGYFSTAWSSSGALCAVASENGYITVLDVQKIRAEEPGEDCLVTLISSTRPHAEPGPGSIRTLHFSCQPWDLLIWSEGRGRVCVADMRYGLNSRQTLMLKPDTDASTSMTSLIRVSYGKDVQAALMRVPSHQYLSPRYATLMQHVRDARESLLPQSSSYTHSPTRFGSRRRLGQLLRREGVATSWHDEDTPSSEASGTAATDDQGMNADERMILEVLRSAAHTTEPVPPPRSIRYRSRDETGPLAPPPPAAEQDMLGLERQYRMLETASILRRHGGNGEHTDESVSTSNERQQALRIPRRWEEANSAMTSARFGDARTRLRSQMVYEDSYTNGTPNVPYSAARHHFTEEHQVSSSSDQYQRALNRERRLREFYKLTQGDVQLLRMTSLRNREDGPESAGMLTAGVIVGSDGQTIWAGCQEGIFEFKLNMRDLMNFPSLEAR